jgi:GNAT superfamily N-acetyltransferase
MIIKLSQIDQLEGIFEIFNVCKDSMEKDGIFQWTDSYPNRQIILEDLSKSHSYSLFLDQLCCGVITLNTNQEPEYSNLDWDDKDGSCLVVHRLAVLPAYQKRGFASQLMNFAENYALEVGATSIRLDTYSANPKAVNFYEKRGYVKRGEVFFKGRKLAFFCFEKRLK